MEKENELKKHIEKLCRPIFEKAADENKKTLVSVGPSSLKNEKFTYYQPHNYRLYLDFNKKNFQPNPISTTQSSKEKRLVTLVFKYLTKNYGKEHEYQNFLGCRIRVKKTQVEVTNHIEHKRWYVIKILSRKEVFHQVKEITDKKDRECIQALKSFIKLFGGSSKYQVLNRMSDDKVMNDSIKEKIPKKMKFRTSIVKKLYNEPNIEYNDPVTAANAMHNMGIEELAPEISMELATIKEAVYGTIKQNESTSSLIREHIHMNVKEGQTMLEFHKDIRVHNRVLKGIDKSFKKFNSLLSQKKITEY